MPESVDTQSLYREVKPELESISTPLFDFALNQLNKRGSFSPFGAYLDRSGKIQMIAIDSGKESNSSSEMLSLVHQALRESARNGAKAIAVCEFVTIGLERQGETKAVKVSSEHVRGLAVAFFLSVRKPLFGKWKAEKMFVKGTTSEIGGWTTH